MAYFYNNIIRGHLAAFGFLFRDILVRHHDSLGNLIKELMVPIAYSNKDKLIEMFTLRGNDPSNYEDNIETTLPRFGFEVIDYNYNKEQKLNRLNKYVDYEDNTSLSLYANNTIDSTGSEAMENHTKDSTFSVYTPVPYKMRINLYLMTNKETDSLQIIEQIVPMFTPDVKINMKYKIGKKINLSFDESICLDHVSKEVINNQDASEPTKIIHTFSFTFDIKFFNSENKNNGYLIKRIIFNISPSMTVGNPDEETVEIAAAPLSNNIVVNLDKWYNQFYNYMYFDCTDIESSQILDKWY